MIMNTERQSNMRFIYTIFAVFVVVAGSFFTYLYFNSPVVDSAGVAAVSQTPTGGTIPQFTTFTDPSTGYTFQYPLKLGTTYVNVVDWPPKIQEVSGPFSCVEAGLENARTGITERRVIGGREYCVTRESEGAAGSTYTNYAYAMLYKDSVLILTFSLRMPQCMNYDNPQRSSCYIEEAGFNIDNVVEGIVGSLR